MSALRELVDAQPNLFSRDPDRYVEFPCPACRGGWAEFTFADERLRCLGQRYGDGPPCGDQAVLAALENPSAVPAPDTGGPTYAAVPVGQAELNEAETRREVARTIARREAPRRVAALDQVAFAAVGQDDEDQDDALARFTVLEPDDLRDRPTEPDIVEGVVGPPGTLSMINGYRGSMKSLTALGLAAAVGAGLPEVYGLAVTLHGPVLYAYLEGASGLSRRLRAWEAHHGRPMAGVSFIHDPLDLRQPADVRALSLLGRRLGAKLVVLDSVAKTGGGREDAEDFSAYRAGLEALRDATGAAVLVLHNSGHDRSRARGHSTLVDGVDSAVVLIPRDQREGGGVTARDEKSRDSAALAEAQLRFEAAGPLNPRTGEAWSGVVVRQSFDESLHAALGAVERDTARVLAAIDAAGGEIAPGDLAKVLGVTTDRGELKRAMAPILAGGQVTGNGKSTRAMRYLRTAVIASDDL